MKETDLEALLGRSLTQRESTNQKLYLKIAIQNLEELLCISLSCEKLSEARVFETREGYRTVFTDVFSDVSEITVDGETVPTDLYYPAQWDKRNAKWFNSIVLNKSKCSGADVEITATWGFDKYPSDLKYLIAQVFANVSKAYKPGDVKSKKVEDFSITFGDLSDDEKFIKDNRLTINKYSMCTIGDIRHGRVRRIRA